MTFGAASSINSTAGPLTFAGDIGLGTSAVTINGGFDTSFSSFITITGSGSLTKNGAGNFNISSDGAVLNFDLIVNSGAVNFSGSGPVFSSQSSIALNGGTMSVASILTLSVANNATFTKAAAATLNLGAGMTISSGADATFAGNYSATPSALYRVTGIGSTLTANEFLVNNDARLEVTAGAAATMQSNFQVGSNTNGTVVLDQGTLNATALTSVPTIGGFGGTGSFTVRNSGSADFTGRLLAIGNGGTGNILVEKNGSLIAGQFLLGLGGTGSATVTVTDVGSILRTTSASNSEIGSTTGATGVVNLNQGGELNVAGGLIIRPTGVLNINGGILTMAPSRVLQNEGVLNFNFGKITLTQGFGIGAPGSLLGINLLLTPGKELEVTSTTTVDSPGAVVIDGGVLRVNQLLNNGGTIDLRRGTLEITGPGTFDINSTGPLGQNVAVGTATNLLVPNGLLNIGPSAILSVTGGSLLAGTMINSGNLLIDSGAATVSSTATNANGAQLLVARNLTLGSTFTNSIGGRLELAGGTGRITGAGTINNNGLITGDGTIANPLNNTANGEIRAEQGKTLVFTGSLGTNSGRMNLLGGELDFAQALTNAAGGRFNGRGTLNFAPMLTNSGQMQFTTGLTDVFGTVNQNSTGRIIVSGGGSATFYGPVNNFAGSEFRVSQDSKAIFFDTVSGGAAFTGSGTKYFEAGSPALGPVQTTGSSVIEAAASVTATRFREDSLTVNGEVSISPDGTAAGTSLLNSLTIAGASNAWEGQLHLNNNSLIVRTADLLTIANQIRDGLDASGGLIGSSLPNRRLGAITNGLPGSPLYSSFQGISGLTGGEVLIRDVIIGDLNLDGTVSISDFIDLAANFNRTGNTTWAMGDVNYDNAVTISDFIDLASNFNQSLAGETITLEELPSELAPALRSTVPEPASIGWIAFAAVLFARRTHFKPHLRPCR